MRGHRPATPRLRALKSDIEQRLAQHQVGQLLATIDGIGPQTAACIMAEVGDPARFASLSALASYVGSSRACGSRGNARKLALLPRCRSAMGGCGAHCGCRYPPSASIRGCELTISDCAR